MKLFFVNGMRAGEELDFAVPEITVGRELDNMVNIPVDGVSRYHGRFRRDPDGTWFVEDCGSTNGIKCNRIRIHEPYRLQEGDLVEFGNQMLRVNDLTDSTPRIVLSPLDTVAPAAAPIRLTAEDTPAVKLSKPAPEAAPEPKEDNPSLTELSNALKNGNLHLFGGKKSAGGKSEDSAAESGERPKKRHISNLLFYTIVICLMLMGVAFFYRISSPQNTRTVQTESAEVLHTGSFMLYYEKHIISADNIFYFVLHIENGKASFQLDDLKSGRKSTKSGIVLSDEDYESFHGMIEQEKFFAVTSPEAGSGLSTDQDFRRMVICDRSQLHEVTVLNNMRPRAFENLEQRINQFAEEYALRTFSMTPAELREQAELHFNKAEDLFQNRESRPANLRDAIKRYRLCTEYLDAFVPKPKIWDMARKRLEEAERIRRTRITALKSEQVRLAQLREFAALPQILDEIMALSENNSPDFINARKRRIRVDSFLREQKGRR